MFQCVDIGWDTFWDTFGTKSVTETLTKKWNEAGGTNTCHRVSCPVHRFITMKCYMDCSYGCTLMCLCDYALTGRYGWYRRRSVLRGMNAPLGNHPECSRE